MNENTLIKFILMALLCLSTVALFGKACVYELNMVREYGEAQSKPALAIRKTMVRDIFGYVFRSQTLIACKKFKSSQFKSVSKKDKVGKWSVILLVTAFLLAFWGGLLLSSMLLLKVVLALLLMSLSLSIIGVLKSDDPNVSRTVLLLYAIMGALTMIGYGIALLVLKGRED